MPPNPFWMQWGEKNPINVLTFLSKYALVAWRIHFWVNSSSDTRVRFFFFFLKKFAVSEHIGTFGIVVSWHSRKRMKPEATLDVILSPGLRLHAGTLAEFIQWLIIWADAMRSCPWINHRSLFLPFSYRALEQDDQDLSISQRKQRVEEKCCTRIDSSALRSPPPLF